MMREPRWNVRPVCEGDREAWCALRAELWPSEADDHAEEIGEFFAPSLNERPQAAFVAEGDESLLGFAEASIRSFAEGCAPGPVTYLEGWFVVAEARGRGLGAALLRAVEAWGREQGCREIASDAELDNLGSQAAHRALGFQEEARVVCYRKKLD